MPGFNITKADIQQWERELQELPLRIEQFNSDIKNHQARIRQLKPELESVNAKIAPIDTTIESISARIDLIESIAKIQSLEPQIPPHEKMVEEYRSELAKVRIILDPINEKINKLEKAIEIKKLQFNNLELQNKISQTKAALETTVSLHRLADISTQSTRSEIEQLNSQIRSLENQNSTDGLLLLVNSFTSQPQPQAVAQPQPVPVSQFQPQPVPVYQPPVVGCHDPNSNIRHAIERRRSEIYHLQQTLAMKRSTQSLQENEVSRLKTEARRYESELSSFNSQLANGVSKLTYSYSDQEKSWASSQDLLQLQVELQQQQSIRAPHESERLGLRANISEHNAYIEKLSGSISQLKKRIDFLTDRAKDFSDIHDVNDLNAKLKQQHDIKKPFSDERVRISREINHEVFEIDFAKSEIRNCEAKIADHQNNHFLISLRDAPETVFENLVLAMRRQLAGYDYQHPSKQSYKVRVYLKNFEQEMQRIKNITLDQEKFSTQPSLLNNPSCIKYLILCGSFWQILEEIKGENENNQFASLMKQLLSTEIDPRLCMEMYRPYQNMQLPEAELTAYEQQRYDAARQAFLTTLSTLPVGDKKVKQLHELGLGILKKVEARKSIDIDIKHATLILENSNNLAINPTDFKFQEKQTLLANHVPDDQSASKKKCWGILLMFLGAAIAIPCGAVALTVCPFAGFGAGVGVGIFATGLGLFRSGRNDLTRNIHDFKSEAEEVEEHAPPSYTPLPSAPALT